jgi:hypothetical protein
VRRLRAGLADKVAATTAELDTSLGDGLAGEDITLLLGAGMSDLVADGFGVCPALDLLTGLGTEDTSFSECLGVRESGGVGFGNGLSESIGRAAGLHARVGREEAVTGFNGVGLSFRVSFGKSLSSRESSSLETVAWLTGCRARASLELGFVRVSKSVSLGLALDLGAWLAYEMASWVWFGYGLPLFGAGLTNKVASRFGVSRAGAWLADEMAPGLWLWEWRSLVLGAGLADEVAPGLRFGDSSTVGRG